MGVGGTQEDLSLAMSTAPESAPRLQEEPSLADGAQASDSSKLKTLLSILKRTVGVKDLASLYVQLLIQAPIASCAHDGADGRWSADR